MAYCTVCDKDLGLFCHNGADEYEADTLRHSGYDIPAGLCKECFATYRKNIDALHQPPDIPVYTLQSIEGEKHYPVGVVSAHTAIGTGNIRSFLSSATGFLGSGSKSGSHMYKNEIWKVEQGCLIKLRIAAADLGADAVLDLQTTYTELAAAQGQILICMHGTAVKKITPPDE